LNAIAGWAAVLLRRPLDPSVAKGIAAIDRNAQAQAKIIEDILDMSRISVGKLRLEPKPADLVAIAREAIEVVRPSAAAKNVSIDFAPHADVCLLIADPDRLQQVIWNLLSNAVKFTDGGGYVRISIEQHSSNVVLSVADNGRGIESEFLPFLFESFWQIDASTTRRFGGLGLGLALVRHIVELHGGTVRAESAGRGLGSTLHVSLPIRAVAPARERPARPPSPPPSREGMFETSALRGLRVLVVDDDLDARDIITSALGDAGAVVRTAESAAAGFDALRPFRPQVLISDIGMPGEDGLSFIRRVRALKRSEGGAIPSIALTAYARSEDRTRVLAAGFTTHVGKPVNPYDLVAAVASLALFVQE
jgi:CheY-like chemotaxis protein